MIVGVGVETPDGVFTCRAMVLMCTVDLQARAMLCNMKALGGEFSCCTCEDEGDNTVEDTPLHHVWPYTNNCTIRTKE